MRVTFVPRSTKPRELAVTPPRPSASGWLAWLGIALAVAAMATRAHGAGAPDANTVLILDESVSGGVESLEAVRAAALGYTVEVVAVKEWLTKTTEDFATYRAIVLGDPNCASTSPLGRLEATTDIWGPAITGNVIVAGTDPVYHSPYGGGGGSGETRGVVLTERAIAFATGVPGATGAYVSLSCYYAGEGGGSGPVPLLDAFTPGGFSVVPLAEDAVHVVASHPALAGLDDATLSDWRTSVHEGFDRWPADFQVIAMAPDVGTIFRAGDGIVGTPYIIARSREVRGFSVGLTPPTATNDIGTAHTVTAQFLDPVGRPLAGMPVGFLVTDGPNAGAACAPTDCLTDDNGQVSFTWMGTGGAGTDTVLAFVDANESGTLDAGEPQATATKTWVDPCGNGVLDPGEQCDDGNQAGGDCCASNCMLEADGSACDDGNAGTTGDTCTAGACAGAHAAVDIAVKPKVARIDCTVDPASGEGTGTCSAVGFADAPSPGPALREGARVTAASELVQVTRRVDRRIRRRHPQVVIHLKLNRLGRTLLRERGGVLDVHIEVRVVDRAGRLGLLTDLLRFGNGQRTR
jgi:cysteine-rich repeat protein